ncbi:unnamed protein product [Nesidiocoris tenuis]|uniref:Uncharacterized protein n=1 Tax=Nesidiocoris tenuis TaxID=355587 RepID=A0A6H5HBN9_9HEMI|nr:unnamed protein product [Nesidiocoris tenuis]
MFLIGGIRSKAGVVRKGAHAFRYRSTQARVVLTVELTTRHFDPADSNFVFRSILQQIRSGDPDICELLTQTVYPGPFSIVSAVKTQERRAAGNGREILLVDPIFRKPVAAKRAEVIADSHAWPTLMNGQLLLYLYYRYHCRHNHYYTTTQLPPTSPTITLPSGSPPPPHHHITIPTTTPLAHPPPHHHHHHHTTTSNITTAITAKTFTTTTKTFTTPPPLRHHYTNITPSTITSNTAINTTTTTSNGPATDEIHQNE